MINPILSQINSQRNNANSAPKQVNPQLIQQIKDAAKQAQMMQNPMLALNQMVLNNPQLQQALNFIKESGGNPQTAFMNLARQQGYDPQDFINQLQSS